MLQKAEEVIDPYSVRQSGTIGHEILDQDGVVVAWTTDPVMAALIATLLTESQEMFIQP